MMKRRMRITTIFLVAIVLSCGKRAQTGGAIISGKVKVNWSNEVKLSGGPIVLTDQWISRLNLGDTLISIEPNGSFQIELSMDKADFYRISHESSEVEVFLEPSDSIFLDFESSDVVKGSGKELNRHLETLRNQINSYRRYVFDNRLYDLSVSEFASVLDSLRSNYLEIHDQFKSSHEVHKTYDQKVIADIDFRLKLFKVSQPGVYKEITGERLDVSDTYFDDLAKGSLQNPEYLKSLDFILFLDSYVDAISSGEYKFDIYWHAPIEKIHPRYETIAGLIAHADIKDYLLSQHLHDILDNHDVKYISDLMPRYREDCTNPILVKQIEERFDKEMTRREEPSEIQVYKVVDGVELEAHIFYPEDHQAGDKRSAYLFFHGGGWAIGSAKWGYSNCKRYRDLGMVAISFEYRLVDIHRTNIVDCIKDAKSAIQWSRKESVRLGIDSTKIVAAGFSAGGHLAASTAILREFNGANGPFSSEPNAIIVQSASYNTTKSDWFSRQSDQKPKSISTYHNVESGLVPSIFFHGAEDHLAPLEEFTQFKNKMDSLGNDYEYQIFEGVGHFFNNDEADREVDRLTKEFLTNSGFL